MNKQAYIDLMRKTQAPLMNMVEMLPEDRMDFAPAEGFMNVGQVLKHLSENWCLLKMMVTEEWPFTEEEMTDAMKLENMPSLNRAEALPALKEDLETSVAYIEKEISEEDFAGRVVKAPWGFEGEIWKAVEMMREHQLNHKMQLHLYMKMMGLPVNTMTLYGM